MAAILGKTVGHMGATGQQLHHAINKLKDRQDRERSFSSLSDDGEAEGTSRKFSSRTEAIAMSGLKAFGAQKESVGLKFTQVKDSLQEDDDGGGRVPLWKRTFYPFEPWIIRWEISVSGLITWGLIELPFKVCFEAEESGPWDGAALFSLFIDAILMCDVLIKFRTGYCEPLTGARAPPRRPLALRARAPPRPSRARRRPLALRARAPPRRPLVLLPLN